MARPSRRLARSGTVIRCRQATEYEELCGAKADIGEPVSEQGGAQSRGDAVPFELLERMSRRTQRECFPWCEATQLGVAAGTVRKPLRPNAIEPAFEDRRYVAP